MITILIRTLIIYILLILSMRLMGKRQIAELEISDLVSTLLLSEIASLPIENRDIPVSYAVIPIITIMTLEIISSALPVRFPRLKNLLTARPGILIRMGKPDFAELERSRMTPEELMVALRHSGTGDISQVAYAILEQNGSISVIPRAQYLPATASDLGQNPDETGIFHIIVERGRINDHSLSSIGCDRRWLDRQLAKAGIEAGEVMLMLADDARSTRIFRNSEVED